MLSTELRDTTHDAHQRLEALPFASALKSGELPLESYVGYLRIMAVIHSVMEHELPVEADKRIATVWDDGMRRLPALGQDLAYFAPQAVRDIPAAHAAAEAAANAMLQRSVQAPITLLGYLYVLEGSTLGAAVLGPLVKKTLRLKERGLTYLQAYGDATQNRWQSFGKRINGLTLSMDERQGIIAAAVEAFEKIHQGIDALYPFDQESLVLKVTSLNPEAGSHPIPQDPREIEAAQRAGERCLREYPYFIWRYGERGRRFTDSDGAWLVTLVNYPQARIDRQIAWLGGVLATRGMPRLLLQRHLELLYEELLLRVPEQHENYAKLLVAADKLAEQRKASLSDEVLDRVQQDFDQTVGPVWRNRLRGTGTILASAVADEHTGLPGVLDNVRDWHTDPLRFPPQWINAVMHTIDEAESALLAGPAETTNR